MHINRHFPAALVIHRPSKLATGVSDNYVVSCWALAFFSPRREPSLVSGLPLTREQIHAGVLGASDEQ